MKEKDNFQNRKKYFKAKIPTKIPNRKWAKDLNEHFMKKVYTWPLNT